jgi:hypothetical protein
MNIVISKDTFPSEFGTEMYEHALALRAGKDVNG